MRLLKRKRLWRRLGRLTAVLVSLCAYLLTAFGFPVAVPRVAAGEDVGQATAPAARPCGCAPVEPDAGCCCCGPKGGKSCCAAPAPVEEPGPEEDDPPVRLGWAMGESVLRCRGMATSWVGVGAVLPACPLTFRVVAPTCDRVFTADLLPVAALRVPPAPPPRPVSL